MNHQKLIAIYYIGEIRKTMYNELFNHNDYLINLRQGCLAFSDLQLIP